MPRFALPLLLTAAVFGQSPAQEPIRFARTPDISPDGKQVAFSYLGDIWTVEAIGGVARPVTMHEAHDYFPVFSPDGRHIAFSSNRYGGYDVFVVPAVGGKPKRLTFDSGGDFVQGWTPDGKGVVFASNRSSDYPGGMEMYTVPADGGAEKKLTGLFEAKEVYLSPAGGKAAFVRGPGNWARRGYRGSSNDDLYLANADGTGTRRLTTFNGQDGSPMWAPDGNTVYYVSECGGGAKCANIMTQPLNGLEPAGEPKLLTRQTDDLIRRARISRNGEWIVYECGADLFVVNTKGGTPRKLAIEVHADDKSNTERTSTFVKDATEFALSSEERHAVVVVHGQLFLTKLPDGGKATRLTDHAAADHSPVWAPDGQKVLFCSDRGGTVDLYAVEANDPDHPAFTKAHLFKTIRLTNNVEEESKPAFNPKGDRVSFLRGGQLWTMKPDGTDQKVLVADKKVVDYEWSPDGKWVAYSRMDGSFASEIYLAPAADPGKAVNVSRYATVNEGISWGGGKIAFVSQRRGMYAMHVLPLQKPAADGTKVDPNEIDLDDIHRRIERPASQGVDGDGAISADGTHIAFRSISNGDDLWLVSTDGKSLNRLTTGNQQPRQITWAKRGSGTVYFLNRDGELRFARPGFGGFGMGAGDPGKVPFQCKLTVKRDEEFAEMFAQCWRALNDQFYDKDFHGADWTEVRAKYAPLVAHCAAREDLYALVSLMLGELNASHLGISGRLPTPQEETADLGLLFDDTFAGPGLKVAEVLKRGPADKRGLTLKAGDVITHIDRVELSPAVNVAKLLNGRAGDGVQLTVRAGPSASDVKKIEVAAVARDKVAPLLYDRWVAKNADEVTKRSGGKLGYIHIPGMDESGLEAFVRSLYSDNFDKEGIVLDVRYNGGGFTHDQVLNYLTGKDHTRFVQRDGGEGGVLRNFDRKWSKPLALLVNNRSYSDAEIFPHAFRTAGLGKVVGEATGGLVIGTSSTRLIDGSTFRLPRIGVYRNGGVNMDKEGVPPDVPVEITPADWAKGDDTQLTKAVEVLTTDVAAWKAAKAGTAVVSAPATKPTTPPEAKPDTKPQDATKPSGSEKK